MCRQLDAFACQQLSVHLARNQVALAGTNCRAPQRPEPQLARCGGDMTHRARRHICNDLQEVHSSKLISIKPCDWFLQSSAEDFCHREQLLTAHNAWPWNQSSSVTSPSQEKVMTAPQGPVQASIIVAKLSAAKPRFCSTSKFLSYLIGGSEGHSLGILSLPSKDKTFILN